jgi:hypothetical protein
MTARAQGMWRQYVALFLVVVACTTYFFPRWADWNQNSRFDLVTALVDDHTFMIDKYAANTGDYAVWQDHYYSDKAPGMALLGVPVYAAFEALTPSWLLARLEASADHSSALGTTLNPDGSGMQADKIHFFVGLVVTTLVTVALPATVLALVFFWAAGRMGCSTRERWVVTLLYALGTCAFPYSNSFVGHQTSAFFLFTAFAILFAVRQSRLGRSWLLLAGFFLSAAMVTEYPTGLIVAVVGLYALLALSDRIGVVVRMVLGGVLPVVGLLIHDIGAFGTPLPVGYFHSALWTDVHDTGFVSLTYPHLDALWGITFGIYRGLFFLSPYLLFAVVGARTLWRRGWRAEVAVLLAVPVVFFLFNSSSAMWQGGFGVGPRYVVACLPFLALLAGVGVTQAWRSRLWRPVVLAACAWSVLAIWTETIGGQAFPDFTPNPLFDFSLPKLLTADVARNAGMLVGMSGFKSLLPLVAVAVIATLIALLPAPKPPRLQRDSTDSTAITRKPTWA